MGENLPGARIASQLGISAKTVYNYRSEVHRKLGTRSIADVARFMVRMHRIESKDDAS